MPQAQPCIINVWRQVPRCKVGVTPHGVVQLFPTRVELCSIWKHAVDACSASLWDVQEHVFAA